MTKEPKPIRTAKQKKLRKMVAEIHKRDITVTDRRSDTAIMRKYGYSENSKPSEVFKSKSYLAEHKAFYSNKKTPDQLSDQLAAKARKNVFEGLDNEDDKVKLEYTKLQFRQEESEASRIKLNMKDVNGNMLTLLGVNATDAIGDGLPIHHMEEINLIDDES